MVVTLRSLLDNSNLWFISILASADRFWLIQIVNFLILGMISIFLFSSAHFGYYSRRLYVIFKSFTLADSQPEVCMQNLFYFDGLWFQ